MGIYGHKSTKTSTTVQTPGAGGVSGAGKRARSPAPGAIIAKIGLTAEIKDMDSAQLRALRDEVGEIAAATRVQEMEDKRKSEAAAKEAKKAAKAVEAEAREDARAEQKRLKAQAAGAKKAQAAELKSLKAVAKPAASMKTALGRVLRMGPGHISAALRDETGLISEAFKYVKAHLNEIGAIPEYVTPGTGQAPLWALKATGNYRVAFRAIDFIHQMSRHPLASALHVDEAFDIKAHAAWAGIGLDAEAESDSGSEAESDSGSEEELDAEAESGSAAEIDHDGKRPRVEFVDPDTAAAMLPPVPDPLMPADFAAIAASNADGQWRYETLPPTPEPAPESDDDADMLELPPLE